MNRFRDKPLTKFQDVVVWRGNGPDRARVTDIARILKPRDGAGRGGRAPAAGQAAPPDASASDAVRPPSPTGGLRRGG